MNQSDKADTAAELEERRRVGEAMAAAVNAVHPQRPFQVVLAALDIAVGFAEEHGWSARSLISALLVSECGDDPQKAIGEIEKIIANRRSKLS
jgi:hypothetical protein